LGKDKFDDRIEKVKARAWETWFSKGSVQKT